jgi:deoxyxylulose-5-phosphate synthase
MDNNIIKAYGRISEAAQTVKGFIAKISANQKGLISGKYLFDNLGIKYIEKEMHITENNLAKNIEVFISLHNAKKTK